MCVFQCDITVVEIGGCVASACGTMLADLGANVFKFELHATERADPMRRDARLLSRNLHRGKHSIAMHKK